MPHSQLTISINNTPDITPLSIIEPATIEVEGRHNRWQANTDKRRDKLTGGQRTIVSKVYDQKEIESLPISVQRFFKTVLNVSSG